MRNELRGWNWKQRFTLRACTVLLVYAVALLAFGLLTPALDSLPEPLATAVQACGWSVGWVLLASALLAAGCFVHSIIKRRPQLQFLLEFAIALITYELLPMT